MISVEKKVKREYTLQLTEKEYFAILTLVGGVAYADFKDLVNVRYSVRLGRDIEEDFEIITREDWKNLYALLDDNK